MWSAIIKCVKSNAPIVSNFSIFFNALLEISSFLFSNIFFCLLFQSCEEIDINEGVPSYINIPSIEVVTDPTNEGSNSHKITDAWVYFDNNLQGVYTIPVTFPVLLSGKQNINIKAGIKNNGISATRVQYPFYGYFNAEITLTKDSVIELNPVVFYTNVDSIIFEDFESNYPIIDTTKNSDTTYLSNNTTNFEGNSGGVHLVPPHLFFEIVTKEIFIHQNRKKFWKYMRMKEWFQYVQI